MPFSSPPAVLTPTPTMATLTEIATHLQIAADFQIWQASYPPLDLPETVLACYRQLPTPFQQRLQQQKLRDYLYDIYFSHELELEADAAPVPPLKNELLRGVNRDFYAQLHEANPGQGYFDPDWSIVRQESDGSLAVQKEDLTVHIERDRHLHPAQQTAHVGERVAIRLPKNRLEAGFYVAVGNAGLVPEEASSLEICFNLSAVGAIALMQHIPAALNAADLPFSLKALYDPAEYGRYDAVILQIERDRYADIYVPLQQFYHQGRSHLDAAIPLFMKPLAPGIGLAEDPDDDDTLDFGLQRCQLVAQGLLVARALGDETPAHRLHCIMQQFEHHQIDLAQPYLNPDSGDRYSVLNEFI